MTTATNLDPFARILGQDPAILTLRRALAAGRVHHAYRFEGPDGVGKELTAMALAEVLVCGTGTDEETKAARRRVQTLSESEPHVPLHPDVVLLGRGLYAAVTGAAEAAGIGVPQIRNTVLPRIGFRPHEGKALVFIIRDADEITPQAANALLKTLEEPPADTYFVLLTHRPRRLLGTILSRTLAVRFGPLPDAVVARILAERGLDPATANLAQGSAGAALELADTEQIRARREFVEGVDEALRARDLVTAVSLVDAREGGRDELRERLAWYAQELAERARRLLSQAPAEAERLARRHGIVLDALGAADRNAAPALLVESLLLRLRQA